MRLLHIHRLINLLSTLQFYNHLHTLSGMRKLFLGNGERALLLICLRKDPGNYRGITLLSVVGEVFCKVLNNRLVHC